MAQNQEVPEFYKNYSASEIDKFETILRLIHSSQPNVALAKKMVTDFSDNHELERFKGFKKEFESAMQQGVRNIEKLDAQKEKLEQKEGSLKRKNEEIVHSHTHQMSEALKDRSVSRSDIPTQEPPSKKHKR
ncbi:MAG: hypothetical protein AB7I18_12740 [Candidatus Berkiella sp.]